MSTGSSGKNKKISPLTIIGIIAAIIFAESGNEAAIGIIAIIIVIAAVAALVKAAAKNAGGSTEVHSHDRLNSVTPYTDNPEGLQHYKIQLDGFLKAGIIDRAEYNVLLRKYAALLKHE